MGEDMSHREPKRYTVSRSGDGYEVQDPDAKGARVYFSDSRKSARKMARQLNKTHRTEALPTNKWSTPLGGG